MHSRDPRDREFKLGLNDTTVLIDFQIARKLGIFAAGDDGFDRLSHLGNILRKRA